MPILRSIVVVIVCGLCFGSAGGLLGVALGVGAPAYYRGVFHAGNVPGFNPVVVGLGLGVTQGLICGIIVGCVVVLARALARPPKPTSDPGSLLADHVDATSSRPSWIRGGFAVLAILAAITFGGVVGFVAGAVVGQLELYQQSTDAKLAKIRPVLRDQRFAGVDADYSSAAQVYLIGKVGSEQAYTALEERMQSLFGDEEARFMMGSVEVAKE